MFSKTRATQAIDVTGVKPQFNSSIMVETLSNMPILIPSDIMLMRPRSHVGS